MKYSKSFLIVVVAILVTGVFLLQAPAESDASKKDFPSSIRLTDDDEPGEPLRISGTVYDFKTSEKLAGVHVHVYHTDVTGYYSPGGRNEREHRLNGDMLTDKDGLYQFETIRPGPYPGNSIPAHIHYEVELPDGSEHDFELLFEGDPNITSRQKERAARKGDFFAIRKLEKEDGVWVGVYDLYVKR